VVLVRGARNGAGTRVLPGEQEEMSENISDILPGGWDCHTSLLKLCRCRVVVLSLNWQVR